MVVLKIYWHIIAVIKISFYKIIFGRELIFPYSSTFRERFNLVVKRGYVQIGTKVFFNNDCSITCEGATITIGDGTIFGEGVKIYCHNHKFKDTSRPIKEQGYTSAPVVIGKHCWIGSNVVILKGVTIGDNCVVGAGCVLYKDVMANSTLVNAQNLTYISGGVILSITSSSNDYLVRVKAVISTEAEPNSIGHLEAA